MSLVKTGYYLTKEDVIEALKKSEKYKDDKIKDLSLLNASVYNLIDGTGEELKIEVVVDHEENDKAEEQSSSLQEFELLNKKYNLLLEEENSIKEKLKKIQEIKINTINQIHNSFDNILKENENNTETTKSSNSDDFTCDNKNLKALVLTLDTSTNEEKENSLNINITQVTPFTSMNKAKEYVEDLKLLDIQGIAIKIND